MHTHAGLSAPSPAATGSSGSVDDRSTTFQPVEGGTEHRSGETLLVGAYAGLWLVLMAWLLIQWRKQGALNRRVDDLEAALNAAAATKPAGTSRP